MVGFLVLRFERMGGDGDGEGVGEIIRLTILREVEGAVGMLVDEGS